MSPAAGATISVLQQTQILLLRPPYAREINACHLKHSISETLSTANQADFSMSEKKQKAAQTYARTHLWGRLKISNLKVPKGQLQGSTPPAFGEA